MEDRSQTIRIFISSPGDVAEERDGAKRVIDGLQRLYPGTTLTSLLWEDLPLPATASFQETIDVLLDRNPIDIAVFILWSRLGTPLGPAITRPDGTSYRSGTEREFDLMLHTFEQSGRERPMILAYVRDDYEAFTRKLYNYPERELGEVVEQRKLAEAFIVEQFHDAEGCNLRAYQTYKEPIGFLQRLRVHLRRAIDELLDVESITWTEEPYRGLEVFDIEHAPIFHGREDETCDVLQRLRDQQQAGCAFVVIVGASGSGKSSLARAGVAANLQQHLGDDGTRFQWRVATLVPSLAEHGLCSRLVHSLASCVPEIGDSEDTLAHVAEGLQENAALAVKLSLLPAFARSCEQAGESVRWLLILDQMEELWTDQQTTSEDRECFLSALEALANSGYVSVLATLRSDCYHHAQDTEAFLRMRGERGQFDLRSPDSASIHRLITEPAKQAGLRFERNEQTGRSLDELILEAATKGSDALPLLQYALSDLYRQRDDDRHLLTYSAYENLGGIEGAIGTRAEEAFKELPQDARSALDEVLPLLVSVDVAGEQATVRRRATLSDLTSTPARKTLTTCLTQNRFLTTDREGDASIATLAHEALLRRWDRIADWVTTNRERLQLRARIELSQQRWNEAGREESLLLARGVPLDEGCKLLNDAPHIMTDTVRDYVAASLAHHRRASKLSRRVRTVVRSTIAALLMLILVGAIYVRRSKVADNLVAGLLTAPTGDVPKILEELSHYPSLAYPSLTRAMVEHDEDSDARLHAALALYSQDRSQQEYLLNRLTTAEPQQVPVIAGILKRNGANPSEELWTLLLQRERASESSRLNVAGALAILDPGNEPKWVSIAEAITDQLVTVGAPQLDVWIETLQPVKQHLVPSLCDVFRSFPSERVQILKDLLGSEILDEIEIPSPRKQSQTDLAARILKNYASDDVNLLSDLLLDAQPTQFATLFDAWDKHGDDGLDPMRDELARTPESNPNNPLEDVSAACRQSNAAAALLRKGRIRPLLELIQRDMERPEAMTQFVHRCRASGIQPMELWRCLKESSESRDKATNELKPRIDRSLYGILLALGEFKRSELPDSERQSWTDQLLGWYADHPSSAVHGATGWLLRQWGFEEEVRRLDRLPVPFDETYERDWYIVQVDTPKPQRSSLSRFIFGASSGQIEPIYLTMVVFPPGQSFMSEGLLSDLRIVQFDRPIAVCDREVTWDQLSAFDRDHKLETRWGLPTMFSASGSPRPASNMSWSEAIAYCRWLTKHMNSSALNSSYSSTDPTSEAKSGWIELQETAWWINPEGRGFRLLTQAEWQRVCRGGTSANYSFGEDMTLLDRYAWFTKNSKGSLNDFGNQGWTNEVARLRPNPRGLFDVHGNVEELCHSQKLAEESVDEWLLDELSLDSPSLPDREPVLSDRGPIAGWSRCGGSWLSTALECTTSGVWMTARAVPDRSVSIGFRVAIVPTSEPSDDSQAGSEGAPTDDRANEQP